MTNTASPRKCVLQTSWGFTLWTLLFLLLFVGVFYWKKPVSIEFNNDTIRSLFETYAVAVGPVLALLTFLGLYLIAGVKRVVGLRRFRILNPLVLLAVMLAWTAFGYQLAYREKLYTDIARGIIGYLATPLLYASAAVCVLAFLWFLVTLVRK